MDSDSDCEFIDMGNCETFRQNQNANAIRWGTLYNFRFDANRPPQTSSATIGFFKTGAPAMVEVQAPMPDACALQIVSAVSRKTHGSAGQFDINLPLSGPPGVECRSSGGNHTLLVTFNNDMISGNATIETGTGNISGSPSFSGNTMTINLSGVSDAQTLTIRLSNITDQFAHVMPDALVPVKFLIGDTNGNAVVNASDVAQTKAQVGQSVMSNNFRTDVNTNGTINATDVALVKSHAGL